MDHMSSPPTVMESSTNSLVSTVMKKIVLDRQDGSDVMRRSSNLLSSRARGPQEQRILGWAPWTLHGGKGSNPIHKGDRGPEPNPVFLWTGCGSSPGMSDHGTTPTRRERGPLPSVTTAAAWDPHGVPLPAEGLRRAPSQLSDWS